MTGKELSDKAREFAVAAHDEVRQRRKYTNEPYWVHTDAVAAIVRQYCPDDHAMIAAAYLHDTVEDTNITAENILAEFGEDVAELVGWMTDISKLSDGNRAVRKAMDREHLAAAPGRAQTIKLADLIHNTESIIKYDKGFAAKYLHEKKLLLDVLTKADERLMKVAREVLANAYSVLNDELNRKEQMSKHYNVKQVLLIRRDLKMRRGKEIAQAAHASTGIIIQNADMSSISHEKDGDHVILKYVIPCNTEEWYKESFAKITLQVYSEEQLLWLIGMAKDRGMPACAILDSAQTDCGNGKGVPTWTVGAIGPWFSDEIDELTGNLNLY